MRKYTWAVLTNCDPTHEKEFNEWYDTVHLQDLLRIPGIVSAGRCKVAGTQMTMTETGLSLCGPAALGLKYRYIAYYNIETDDIEAVLKEVIARSNTPQMVISPYLTEAFTVMCERPVSDVTT